MVHPHPKISKISPSQGQMERCEQRTFLNQKIVSLDIRWTNKLWIFWKQHWALSCFILNSFRNLSYWYYKDKTSAARASNWCQAERDQIPGNASCICENCKGRWIEGSVQWVLVLNPLSPNSDQHQFSLNNIHMLPREMVMRVNKMITKGKMLWSVIKLSKKCMKISMEKGMKISME